jgi:hypothetical protein
MKLLPIAALALVSIPFSSMMGQSAPDARRLSIAGRQGSVKVREFNGTSYIALDDVARLMHGSLSFTGNQVFLALPSAQSAPPQSAPVKTGFSKAFLEAGIEQTSTIREWRIIIVNSIQNNSLISEDEISALRRRADKQLSLVAAARNTDDDRNAYPLLVAEFANMQRLSDQFLAKRRQLAYIDPKSIDNDPLDRQILACGRGLAAMAADNHFHEEPACTELQ